MNCFFSCRKYLENADFDITQNTLLISLDNRYFLPLIPDILYTKILKYIYIVFHYILYMIQLGLLCPTRHDLIRNTSSSAKKLAGGSETRRLIICAQVSFTTPFFCFSQFIPHTKGYTIRAIIHAPEFRIWKYTVYNLRPL